MPAVGDALVLLLSVVRLIGKEMNQLERAGVTQNPDYSEYTSQAEHRRLLFNQDDEQRPAPG